MPANSSRPLSRLRWNAPPYPTLGRIENEQTLPWPTCLPPFRMPSCNLSLQPHHYECALRFRGIQGPRESGVAVTGAGRYQQKKKGEGRKAGMDGKKWKGEGKRERAADLVLTFPFSPLRQTKKNSKPLALEPPVTPAPAVSVKKSLCRISGFLETTRRRHAALD